MTFNKDDLAVLAICLAIGTKPRSDMREFLNEIVTELIVITFYFLIRFLYGILIEKYKKSMAGRSS